MFPDLWGAFAAFISRPGVVALVQIVTAIATAASVIVALVISTRSERRQDSRDRIERRASLEGRAERQAVLVKVSGDGTVTGAFTAGQIVHRVRVDNLSQHPVYEVATALEVRIAGAITKHFAQPIAYIAPGLDGYGAPLSVAPDVVVEVVAAHATFVDVYGDKWTTTSVGTLNLDAARTIRSIDSEPRRTRPGPLALLSTGRPIPRARCSGVCARSEA